MENESKRQKLTFKSVFGESIKSTPIDLGQFFKDQLEREKADEKRYLDEVNAEADRVKKMECPLCKSVEKRRFVNYETNGIIGPGSYANIKEDYYICLKCGIHYHDLNKKVINEPYRSRF